MKKQTDLNRSVFCSNLVERKICKYEISSLVCMKNAIWAAATLGKGYRLRKFEAWSARRHCLTINASSAK